MFLFINIKFANSNEVRKIILEDRDILRVIFGTQDFPPTKRKRKPRQMAVCRSPSPLNRVDVKLRVSRQFIGIGVFLKDGGLTMHWVVVSDIFYVHPYLGK